MPQATFNLLNRSKKALLIIKKYGKYGQNWKIWAKFLHIWVFYGFYGNY